MSASSLMSPSAHDQFNCPSCIHQLVQEWPARFPEKASKWRSSQLVCQPRPLSLVHHASRDSVARLEEMADHHRRRSPPRFDHSSYVYYTFNAIPQPPSPTDDIADATASDRTESALLQLTPHSDISGDFQRNLGGLSSVTPPFMAQPQFPPDSPPASALPTPSWLRETGGQPTPTASKTSGENTPRMKPRGAASLHWPPIAPAASSLPEPSWNPNSTVGVSSKDRAFRQSMKERRRARRSSPTQTPLPTSVKLDNTFASNHKLSGIGGRSTPLNGDAMVKRVRKVRSAWRCFEPKENQQVLSNRYNYIPAPPILSMPG